MVTRLLILGASAVQHDAVRAAQSLGMEAWVCARAADGPAAAAADRFVPLDFSDEEALGKLVSDSDIDVVYSVGSDNAMPVACRISEALHLPHFVSSRTAATCNDKVAMRSSLGDLRGNVAFRVVTSAEEPPSLPWPAIVKPADSQGQRGVALVHDEHAFRQAVAAALPHSRSRRAIVEPYLSGSELSVNGYLVEGQMRLLVVTDRVTWPQHTGLIRQHVVPSATTDQAMQEQIREIVTGAAARLQITDGPVYAQVKLQGGAAHILEITPRLDGCHMWKLLRASTGTDLLRAALAHLATGVLPEEALQEGSAQTSRTLRPAVLDFRCQEPLTPADYTGFADDVPGLVDSYRYYEQDAMIRPVNGVLEKIGYTITVEEPA